MIGVFDSGVGGLGILAEIRRLLPAADLIYLADHAVAPYGPRDLAEVRERSETVAGWLIERGCSIVTIACNTASAAALKSLRARFPRTHFVGMEPAVKPATEITAAGRVGVVATAATFQGELFATVVDRFASGVTVFTAACPSWVTLVEAGITSGPEARAEVEACIGPLRDEGIDVLVLACTHYPRLMDVISEVVGEAVAIVDPAPAVARQTARLAASVAAAGAGRGRMEFCSTGDAGTLESALRSLGLHGPVSLLPW
ncbi:MAG TPA: glutamate racemase [Acidimicrobiia bacterium]|nr:glutamate racemase [Acidimicrobiia bacterium]